eukprot:1180671-Prorocentrum_minimum.AAC.7
MVRFLSARGMLARCAKDPQRVKPGCCWASHTVGRLRAHSRQSPHERMNGTATASPTLNLVTFFPTCRETRRDFRLITERHTPTGELPNSVNCYVSLTTRPS